MDTTISGIDLNELREELKKVPAHLATKPIFSIRNPEKRLATWIGYIENECGKKFDFTNDCHTIPLEAFTGFSFDELCKIKYSSTTMLDVSVCKKFENGGPHEIVRKIMSSMWRWGVNRGTWNEIVDDYQHMRHFDIGIPGFDIRLDHTTGYNEFGLAKYSHLFLDGVFAYLLYESGAHVLTIGFSIAHQHRILIQQVQSPKRSGNRSLYRLPKNRMEWAIELFRKNFPGYTLYAIDGKHIVDRTLAMYQKAYDRTRSEPERAKLRSGIDHLRADAARICSIYENVGRFSLGREKKLLGTRHFEIV